MEKKYQIFISSTYEDLKMERKKVQDTILSMYQFPIGMEMFSAADEEQWEIIQETIDSSDYYVLIIGHRYGSVIEEGEYAGISYTQKEFRYALEKGIPILAFLIDKSVPITPDKIEQDSRKKKKLDAFKDEVTTGRMVEWWTSAEDLANKVMNALNKQINRGKRPGWIRADKFDVDGTQKELVEMSRKIRNLEEENANLKNQIVVRSPRFQFELNGGDGLYYTYPDIHVPDIHSQYVPISEEDVKGYNISSDEIEAYNKSLPTEEELDKYLEKYRRYKIIKDNGIHFVICVVNSGTCKANDMHIQVEVSPGMLIMKKDTVDNMKEPQKPETLENPIERYIKRNSGAGLTEKLYNSLGVRPILASPDLSALTSAYNPNYHEDIEDNCLHIWSRELMHTKEYVSDEYYLVAARKGAYTITIRTICEELTEEDVQEFEIVFE